MRSRSTVSISILTRSRTTSSTAHGTGSDVARLCSGDPSIYSALAEQTRRLDAAGVPWDVTPGVPAYAAAAAVLGPELTVPELTQTVILTRTYAESTPMPETESLSRLAPESGHARPALGDPARPPRWPPNSRSTYGPDCPVGDRRQCHPADQTACSEER